MSPIEKLKQVDQVYNSGSNANSNSSNGNNKPGFVNDKYNKYSKKNNKKPSNSDYSSNIKASTLNNRGRYNKNRGSFRGRSNRGQYNSSQTHQNENMADFEGSIQEEIFNGNYKLNGRKTKISINHLLDFQLPEIEREKIASSSNHSTKGNRRRQSDSAHVYLQGDSFINVNYKLLVDESRDYSEQNINPNKPVESDDIVRVIVPKGQSCPICLCDEPVSPRMVICGHIFCYTCLSTFFSIKEEIKNPQTGYVKPKKYKECPLCSSIIRSNNVKDVLYDGDIFKNNVMFPKVGEEIHLDLICRPHNSLLGLPVTMNVDPLKIGNFPSIKLNEIIKYAKMIRCDNSKRLEYLQNDINAIQDQLEIDKALFGASDVFAKKAIEEINTKIMTILSNNDLEPSTSTLARTEISSTDKIDNYNDKTAYYYYQYMVNSSSTKFFLSLLDIKILKAAFENYSKFPHTIVMKVENVQYGSIVTEDFLLKNKYMGHLAFGTEIALIEFDWRNSDILPKEVFDKFSVELKQRRRKYNIKQKREDIQRKQYEYQLEKETAEFYKRENGELTDSYQGADYNQLHDLEFNHSSVFQESLSELKISVEKGDRTVTKNKNKSYNERTIWGTSIEVQMDEKTLLENKNFEEMLFKKMNGGEDLNTDIIETNNGSNTNDDSTSGVSVIDPTGTESVESLPVKDKKNKKHKNSKQKSKILLFSSSHQTL